MDGGEAKEVPVSTSQAKCQVFFAFRVTLHLDKYDMQEKILNYGFERRWKKKDKKSVREMSSCGRQEHWQYREVSLTKGYSQKTGKMVIQ